MTVKGGGGEGGDSEGDSQHRCLLLCDIELQDCLSVVSGSMMSMMRMMSMMSMMGMMSKYGGV